MEVFGCHGFVTKITLLRKSMIPMTLKHQNWVEPLSGSKSSNFKKKFKVFYLSKKFLSDL